MTSSTASLPAGQGTPALPAGHLLRPGVLLALVGFALGSALVASLFPLATYSITLAMFGWAHVLSELRYVDHRFGARIPSAPLRVMVGLLLGVMGLRVAGNLKWMPSSLQIPLELALVAGVCVVLWPLFSRVRPWAGLLAAAIAVGIAVDPLATLLLFSVLHNLTPLGLLAEVLPRAERRVILPVAGLAFVGLPLVIASGGLGWLPGALSELDPIGAGALASHLGVYLPPALHGQEWARRFFAGVVCAQCLHYGAVIHLLPRLLPREEDRPVLPWPSRTTFSQGLVVWGALMTLGFVLSFRDARGFYGVFASVHAWVELPILLLALEGGLGAARGGAAPDVGEG